MKGTTGGRKVENAKQERNNENRKTEEKNNVKEGHLQRKCLIVFDMPVCVYIPDDSRLPCVMAIFAKC